VASDEFEKVFKDIQNAFLWKNPNPKCPDHTAKVMVAAP
jgi:hypothetical protein